MAASPVMPTRETPSRLFCTNGACARSRSQTWPTVLLIIGSRRLLQISYAPGEEEEDSVLVMERAVTVPRGGIEQTASGAFDHLHSIAYLAVLREILIDRELR